MLNRIKHWAFNPFVHSHSCTRVSRGGLDDGVSWFKDPGSLGVLHHAQGDPVFHTASCIEELTLGH